ncbi:nSTAND1 domain-containing NTPase, partial [Flectobacillus roseus]|uniref:nSTAND1 domain-containing NTPase n=1 Tax=Flectobacillus roseus TaxID=502259 RepID=UPI0024B714A8
MSQTQSPFQFLAPYGADKKDSFLGRDQEIEKLYELTFATNLIMVYGSSGTGKTSLVQSGLSKKLSGPDWIPLFIRRGDNFKTSLTDQLKVISKVQKEDTSVSEHLAVINRRYYRPVYLFFDQFEEVFTLSDKQQSYKKELKELFETLNDLQSENTCKIILIIREEFLGLLYESEQYLPNLFDFRLRVEPMNQRKIQEVVSGVFQEFKIQTEPSTLTTTISEKLVEGQANGQLAYLQVYLEKLWREAIAIESTNSTVIIRQQHVDTIKDIQNVLDTYLMEQQKSISAELNIEEKVIKELLDLFVTDDSTKRPRTLVSLQKEIRGGLTETQLKEILKQLETARLLILEKDNYELAHDTLAKVIDSKRDAEQRLIKNLVQNLQTSYYFYKEEKGSLLSEQNVALYDRFKSAIDDSLSEEKITLLRFIEESRTEIAKEKRELEQKNELLITLLNQAEEAKNKAIKSEEKAKVATDNATALYWTSEASKINPIQGLRLLEKSLLKAKDKNVIKTINQANEFIFNQSNFHQWREKRRFEDINSFVSTFYPDSKWLITKDGNLNYQVWSVQTGKQYDFLKDEKNISYATFSQDSQWLITADDNFNYKVWSVQTGKYPDFLKDEKNISYATFSQDSQWLITADDNFNYKVWSVQTGKYP